MVDAQPEIQEIDALVADVAEREEKYRAWVAEQARIHREAVAEYDAALQAAIDAGQPLTTAPPAPVNDAGARLAVFNAERRSLREKRSAVVASVAYRVLPEARTRYDDAMKRARRHAVALQAIGEEVVQLQRAVKECMVAQALVDVGDPQTGRGRVPSLTAPTPASVAAAALGGPDLLAETPDPGVVGMISNMHDAPSSAWEPPIRKFGNGNHPRGVEI